MNEIKVIGKGMNGWHASGIGTCTPNSSSTFSSSGGELKTYLEDSADGVLVYDAGEVASIDWVRMIHCGPMLKVDLPLGETNCFSPIQKDALARMMGPGGLEGDFRSIAQSALDGFSSLDYVAIDIYFRLLRALPGMKTGKVINHQIVWDEKENSYPQEIPEKF